ncbi:MAG: hypothetical protein CMP10_18210 [Zetaproteobacteria bacterium]|nr:hypothetical protein [Pseudobdellovibrionaceae bacterium]|tara:strand:+ start:702 stop:1037 length:336 start_codon:yes stop_codon:yes gene_type:complete
MTDIMSIIGVLKIIVVSSVVFVWFVRYDNIIEEFKQYNYPNWLRDFVGILKISCALMIQSDSTTIVQTGCLGIAILMAAAAITHVKVRNPPSKIIPSFVLLVIAMIIFLNV